MTISSSKSTYVRERHLKRILNFTLTCSRFQDNPFTIVADYLRISISADGENLFDEEKIEGHIFDRRLNAYGLSTYINPGGCRLVINVEIGLPAGKDLNLNVNEKRHLLQLSKDLKGLLLLDRVPEYSDLVLISSELGRYSVHKCIIQAMGNNFTEEPESLRILGQTAQIPISNNLLYDILHFMYSGELINWRNNLFINKTYITELFQVIDRYRLHNLYKLFVSDELQQDRRTSYHCCSEGFPFVLSPPSTKHRWISECYSNAKVVINFEYFFHPDPYFNYSLKFTCEESLFARVILGFEETIMDRNVLTVVYEHDFQIERNETKTVQDCLFERDSVILNLYLFQQSTRLLNIEDFPHKFYFVLYLSYGGECIEILNRDGEIRNETDNEEGHKILSSQLSELLMQRTGADLEIECPSGNQNIPQSFHLHKAIFSARVPGWNNVLENPGNNVLIADRMRCRYRSEMFRLLLDYCYTGKFPFSFKNPIPAIFWSSLPKSQLYKFWLDYNYSSFLQPRVHLRPVNIGSSKVYWS